MYLFTMMINISEKVINYLRAVSQRISEGAAEDLCSNEVRRILLSTVNASSYLRA